MMFGIRCATDGAQPPESGRRFQKPRKSTHNLHKTANQMDFLFPKIKFRVKAAECPENVNFISSVPWYQGKFGLLLALIPNGPLIAPQARQ